MQLNSVISYLNIIERNEDEKGLWGKVFGGGSVEIEVGELLYGLVRATKPEIVIETGTASGYTTLYLAQALADNNRGILHTFEINWQGRARQYIEQAELQNYVVFHVGDCLVSGVHLLGSIGEIDFVFADASHEYKFVIDEFHLFFPRLKIGGLYCFHDTTQDLREKQACDEITTRSDISMVRIHTSRGFDIGVKL